MGVVYHPVNPDTGKVNAQMWAVGSHPPVRGEANMLQEVKDSKALQEEIMAACYNHQDVPVSVDADGVVTGDDALDDINIEL